MGILYYKGVIVKSVKYKAVNIENVREIVKFKAKDIEGAKNYVITNLDSNKSWGIFIDEDD